MIQDIQPKLDNSFETQCPDSESIVFHFDGKNVLCRDDDEKPFPVLPDFVLPDDLIYLFRTGGQKYFLLRDSAINIPQDFHYTDVRKFRSIQGMDRTSIFALATAFHLSEWYSSSRYCGRCGGILMGFFCDVDGSTAITMDKSELCYAEWVKRDCIQGQPDDLSLTNEMMMTFRKYSPDKKSL